MVKKTYSTPLIKNGKVYVWQGLVKAAKDRDMGVLQAIGHAIESFRALPKSKVKEVLDYGSCLRIDYGGKRKLTTLLKKVGLDDKAIHHKEIVRAIVFGLALETFVSAALDTFEQYNK